MELRWAGLIPPLFFVSRKKCIRLMRQCFSHYLEERKLHCNAKHRPYWHFLAGARLVRKNSSFLWWPSSKKDFPQQLPRLWHLPVTLSPLTLKTTREVNIISSISGMRELKLWEVLFCLKLYKEEMVELRFEPWSSWSQNFCCMRPRIFPSLLPSFFVSLLFCHRETLFFCPNSAV